MDFNFNINISNSFNKKNNSRKKEEDIFNDVSTLNNFKNITEISSMSLGSITASQIQDNFKIIDGKKDKNGFWKNILINVVSGIVGTVVGALIIYFVFGIK